MFRVVLLKKYLCYNKSDISVNTSMNKLVHHIQVPIMGTYQWWNIFFKLKIFSVLLKGTASAKYLITCLTLNRSVLPLISLGAIA